MGAVGVIGWGVVLHRSLSTLVNGSTSVVVVVQTLIGVLVVLRCILEIFDEATLNGDFLADRAELNDGLLVVHSANLASVAFVGATSDEHLPPEKRVSDSLIHACQSSTALPALNVLTS